MTTYLTADKHECAEYTAFARYKAPCGIVWVCLDTGDKRLRWYDLSQLTEVIDPRLTGMDYCYPQPCTALTVWRPTIELPIWELGYYSQRSKQKAIPGVNLHMCNVRLVLTLPEVAA